MKKLLCVLLTVCLLFLLAGCSGYRSHYKAVGFVHSNTPGSAFMSFYEFDGTMVFNLRSKNSGEKLKYSAKLETGAVTVYYDIHGAKTELLSVGAGEQTDSALDLPSTGKVCVIVETDGRCRNGDFKFDIV